MYLYPRHKTSAFSIGARTVAVLRGAFCFLRDWRSYHGRLERRSAYFRQSKVPLLVAGSPSSAEGSQMKDNLNHNRRGYGIEQLSN